MADDLTLNPGSGGAKLATDDVGGVHYQRVKPAHGTDGAATDTSHAAPLPVDIGLVAPRTSFAASVAVAAGSSADLDSDQVAAGKTGKLVALLIGASVPVKAELKTVANGASSAVLAALFAKAGESRLARLPSREFVTQAHDAGAGLDGFRLTVTNLDTTRAADLYATFFYDEV